MASVNPKFFPTPSTLRKWLAANHNKSEELWVGFYKRTHEDSLSWGYGAEIATRISNEPFEYLDAPVRRVAALDTFVAYAPQLEDAILPQSANVLDAIVQISGY